MEHSVESARGPVGRQAVFTNLVSLAHWPFEPFSFSRAAIQPETVRHGRLDRELLYLNHEENSQLPQLSLLNIFMFQGILVRWEYLVNL